MQDFLGRLLQKTNRTTASISSTSITDNGILPKRGNSPVDKVGKDFYCFPFGTFLQFCISECSNNECVNINHIICNYYIILHVIQIQGGNENGGDW